MPVSDVITVEAGGGVSYQVTGLRSTVRDLKKMGTDAQDIKDLMSSIGTLVVRSVEAPVLTGALAGSVRTGAAATKAVVRAGGARVPYAGPIHYGWSRHGIRPQPFLTSALERRQGDVLDALDLGLMRLMQQHGFDPSPARGTA